MSRVSLSVFLLILLAQVTFVPFVLSFQLIILQKATLQQAQFYLQYGLKCRYVNSSVFIERTKQTF